MRRLVEAQLTPLDESIWEGNKKIIKLKGKRGARSQIGTVQLNKLYERFTQENLSAHQSNSVALPNSRSMVTSNGILLVPSPIWLYSAFHSRFLKQLTTRKLQFVHSPTISPMVRLKEAANFANLSTEIISTK